MLPQPNIKLKGLIYGAGLTQKRLAYALGVSEPYVSNVINGFKKPSAQFVQNTCFLLGREASDLFPGYARPKNEESNEL